MNNEQTKRRGRPIGSTEATLVEMQKIIDFIRIYTKENSIAPTLSEIAVGIGRKAEDFGNIQPMVKKLIDEGFLESKGRFRSVTVAKKPPRRWFYKPDGSK